ncbi:hypothetical protein AB0C76_35430 [Kitasatospora sp. NPDC048722]|uniref:hypothetical protein n=1 Tax=Kitasatospora sp. NPDC048722 TaxID=3155639 RepID=UPI00340A2E52
MRDDGTFDPLLKFIAGVVLAVAAATCRPHIAGTGPAPAGRGSPTAPNQAEMYAASTAE